MSLLRTAARASVATRVVGNVHRRQQKRWAMEDAIATGGAPPAPLPPLPPLPPAPEPVPVPPPTAGSTDDMLNQLTRLGELRAAGVLNEAEFESQKQLILSRA